jgi:hypothetical protein
MLINGVEFEIDFTDADLIERIDKKVKEVEEQGKELEKNKKNITPAEGIRQECKIVKEFFDYVLGDGSSKKIFGDKNSLRDCLQAFEDLINERDRQLNNFKKVVNKYSPERLKR